MQLGKDQGPGRSLPGPGAGHPPQAVGGYGDISRADEMWLSKPETSHNFLTDWWDDTGLRRKYWTPGRMMTCGYGFQRTGRTLSIDLRIRRSWRRVEGAKGLVGLRSGDGPLSVRARPSGLKRNCDRRTTSTGGMCPVDVHAKSRLTPECLCGHSGQRPRARPEPARTGRGPSPARCGWSRRKFPRSGICAE
jgi:hypothetical protein